MTYPRPTIHLAYISRVLYGAGTQFVPFAGAGFPNVYIGVAHQRHTNGSRLAKADGECAARTAMLPTAQLERVGVYRHRLVAISSRPPFQLLRLSAACVGWHRTGLPHELESNTLSRRDAAFVGDP